MHIYIHRERERELVGDRRGHDQTALGQLKE